MKRKKKGFFLIEIMITLVFFTIVVSIFIRYQLLCLGCQSDGLARLQAIQEADKVLQEDSSDVTDCKVQLFNLPKPDFQGDTGCLEPKFDNNVRLKMFIKEWNGLHGKQHCFMPMIVVKKGD